MSNFMRKKKVLRLLGFFVSICFLAGSFLIAFLLPHGASAASGVPQVISYQGRLLNSSGSLLGGTAGTTYYFKFSIWNVSTGGTAGANRLWPASDPSYTSATVREGVFNVDIDVTGYDFNANSAIYLQIEVSATSGGTYEALSPRQRVAAVAFAQISGAVSGTGQSSMGTTTPIQNSVVSIEATSTQSTGLSIRGVLGQIANLFQIQDSTGANSFVVASSSKVGIGASVPARQLDVANASDVAQLRLGVTGYGYGEIYVDALGDLHFSSNSGTGGNVKMLHENLWVCESGGCALATPADHGNIVVETAVIFDNKFKLRRINASTTVMCDSLAACDTNNAILEFDEGVE